MSEPDDGNQKKTQDGAGNDRLLWIVVIVFIILAIGGMWSIDFFFAPEVISPDTLPDAVGK